MYSDSYVVVTGNLVKDPEIKDVNGSKVFSFIIAVNSGKRETEAEDAQFVPNYYSCSIWQSADYWMTKLEKGTQVQVVGALTNSAYISEKDNQPYVASRVTAWDIKVRARGKGWKKQEETPAA